MHSPHRIAAALRRTPVHLTLILICTVWTVPVLGLLVSSFRPAYDITTTGWWEVPNSLGHLNIGNYVQVLQAGGFGTALGNSLLIAIPAVVVMVGFGAPAAFALAR